MNALKRLLFLLFLHDKFLGRAAATIASVVAAYIISFLPGAPEIVTLAVVVLLKLPEGGTITQAGITAALTPAVLFVLDSLIQEFVVRDNNKVLSDLKDTGIYEGKVDGWVGPQAKQAVGKLIDRLADPNHTDL